MSILTPFSIILPFFFLHYFPITPATSLNNETDFQSLLAFKKAIVSDPQGALNSWNDTLHFCSWEGILCSKKHPGRVVYINLMSRGIIGSLSPHIGNLSFLRNISIYNNTFSGPIPNEIGRLRRLEYIRFTNNSFSGQIPTNISRCGNVFYLNLIDNDLTGVLIPELFSLLKLRILGLSANDFSGIIPPSIGNLTFLERLSVAYCGIEGRIPESLSQLQSLNFLNLAHNNLTGRIPYGLYNISTMSFFSFDFNRLHGTIPSDITFPRLTEVYLGTNYFTGVLPASLSNSSLLQIASFTRNNFTGKIMLDFSRLYDLVIFEIGANNVEGNLDFFSTMSNCTSLKYIELSRNSLSGTLPSSIANFSSQLQHLGLGTNQLSGSIPSGIGNLIGLSWLGIEINDIDGSIPSEIGKLSKMQELYLGMNNLTNVIPSSLGNLTFLNLLMLELNDISGTIPRSLSNCTSLSALSLHHNKLSGSIPPEILSLSSISIEFSLNNNAFTGIIPPEIGSLVNLVVLDLSNNRLSGVVPYSLSQCVVLSAIFLKNNSFSGQIPDALKSMKGVEDLDLSENLFSGPIPSFLGELNLEYLNLSFNLLEGEVPSVGAFRNESVVSLEGNRNLCGGIKILKLPPCPSKHSNKKHHFPRKLQILIPIGVVVICVVLSVCSIYIFIYKKQVQVNIESVTNLATASVLRLSYGDLSKATRGFSEKNLLGVGGSGSVYKGVLEEGQSIVAVKVVDLSTEGASKSFMSECTVLRDIRHRNLVKILSVCSSTDFQGNDFKALVYEFMANGNLDDWLHQKLDGEKQHTGERQSLSLRQRLSIVVDVACALEYLHSGTDSIIVHGDLKPSNILLDDNMIAHVGDFGLAKVLNRISGYHESSSIGIKGTVGYIPPEYGTSNKVSAEGDVYSYGILLMEILTGKRPTDDTFRNYSNLRDFVRSTLPSEGVKILDPVILLEQNQKMDVEFKDGITSLFEVALACTMEVPKDRMLMGDIVKDLHKIVDTFK